MGRVQLHPDAQKRSYLRSGQYGPGMTHAAECEILDYQLPANDPPRYDKDGNAEDYAYLEIQVNSEEFGGCRIFHHEPIYDHSGSRLGTWLTALGIPVGDEASGWEHDTDALPGLKIGIEVADARQDKNEKGKWYTGKLLDMFAVS